MTNDERNKDDGYTFARYAKDQSDAQEHMLNEINDLKAQLRERDELIKNLVDSKHKQACQIEQLNAELTTAQKEQRSAESLLMDVNDGLRNQIAAMQKVVGAAISYCEIKYRTNSTTSKRNDTRCWCNDWSTCKFCILEAEIEAYNKATKGE